MKTLSLLNIGLAREGKADLNALEVINFLYATIGIKEYSIQRSATEKTLVVEVLTKDVPDAFLYSLSVVLGQDCIAAVDGGTSGRLCGPRADKWSPFKAEYFLTLEGASL